MSRPSQFFSIVLHQQRPPIRTIRDGESMTATSTFTQLLSSGSVPGSSSICCFMSTETVRTTCIRDGEQSRTATSTFTQLLSTTETMSQVQVQCCFTSTETILSGLLGTGSPGQLPRRLSRSPGVLQRPILMNHLRVTFLFVLPWCARAYCYNKIYANSSQIYLRKSDEWIFIYCDFLIFFWIFLSSLTVSVSFSINEAWKTV